MAFEFLIWHEFAHIIYGHVDYVRSILGSFELKEKKEKSRTMLDPLVSQTLEMCADSFAAKQSLAIWQLLISKPDALTPELRPYFNTWPSVLRMWMFSTYTFFRLFSDLNNANGIRNSFHPPPSVRSHLVQAIARTVLQNTNNAPSTEDIKNICNDAIIAVELAFIEISQEIDLTHLTFSIQDDAFVHGSFLIKNWENVKPLLQPFTLSPFTF